MYFITGGTGFIGMYVVRELLQKGEKVALFGRQPDLKHLGLIVGSYDNKQVTIIQGDVTYSFQLMNAVKEVQPEVIIHMASIMPPVSEKDVPASFKLITESHINVLEVARHFGVRRVVWGSAPSVFGSPRHHGGLDKMVGDDAPHYPETLYGIYKSTNERLSVFYRNRYGLDSIGLRLCQGYGPGKLRGRPFGYEVFQKALLGEPYQVLYGDDLINWQFVEDIATIVIKACEAPPCKTAVFNTSGEVITMRETVEVLRELAPHARLELLPGTTGLVWHYDTKGLEEEIGFSSPTPVRKGFARTFETLRKWKEQGVW